MKKLRRIQLNSTFKIPSFGYFSNPFASNLSRLPMMNERFFHSSMLVQKRGIDSNDIEMEPEEPEIVKKKKDPEKRKEEKLERDQRKKEYRQKQIEHQKKLNEQKAGKPVKPKIQAQSKKSQIPKELDMPDDWYLEEGDDDDVAIRKKK